MTVNRIYCNALLILIPTIILHYESIYNTLSSGFALSRISKMLFKLVKKYQKMKGRIH